jgi:hypothetical protein
MFDGYDEVYTELFDRAASARSGSGGAPSDPTAGIPAVSDKALVHAAS